MQADRDAGQAFAVAPQAAGAAEPGEGTLGDPGDYLSDDDIIDEGERPMRSDGRGSGRR